MNFMSCQRLYDRSEIEAYLRQDAFLHIYELGDLDDFFWPDTIWLGLRHKATLQAVVLLYTGVTPPVLLAFASPEKQPTMRRLLNSSLQMMPEKFYAHISLGLQDVLEPNFACQPYGMHFKMALTNPEKLDRYVSGGVSPLSRGQKEQICTLYETSYSGNAFDPRMLETQQYFGYSKEDRLVSVAGIHTYSPSLQVAAIGNITTHPDYRNLGLAKSVTATLCRSLLKSVRQIGLNVKADNTAAIHCYQQLGFETIHSYHELAATRKT